MSVLITGALGCSGSAIYDLLKDSNVENTVWCTDIKEHVDAVYKQCDLTDPAATSELIEKTRPTKIYHLAGSFTNDFEFDLGANVLSTKNIIEAVIKFGLNSRILLVGSAAEYGMVKMEDSPITEENQCTPTSFYGLSKVFQTELMHYYVRSKEVDLVMARTFNILAKDLSPRLFLGRLYQQISDLKLGKIDKISTGMLNDSRDYLHIGNVAMKYKDIMELGISGEIYNVGSGKPTLLSELVSRIFEEEQITLDKLEISERTFSKTSTVKAIYADVGKLDGLA